MRVRSENYVLSWGVCCDRVAVTNYSGAGRRGALLGSLPSLLLALIVVKEASSGLVLTVSYFHSCPYRRCKDLESSIWWRAPGFVCEDKIGQEKLLNLTALDVPA